MHRRTVLEAGTPNDLHCAASMNFYTLILPCWCQCMFVCVLLNPAFHANCVNRLTTNEDSDLTMGGLGRLEKMLPIRRDAAMPSSSSPHELKLNTLISWPTLMTRQKKKNDTTRFPTVGVFVLYVKEINRVRFALI